MRRIRLFLAALLLISVPVAADEPALEKPDAAPAAEPAAAPAGWTVPDWFALRGREHPGRSHRSSASMREKAALGLRWLALHQDPQGRWDCDGFSARCRLNVCKGTGRPEGDVAVTGLATLAFLANGETQESGEHSDCVLHALMWLMTRQNDDGSIGPVKKDPSFVGVPIATMALAEAYGMTGSVFLKVSAQRAVDFLEKARNPYLAWRYGVRPQDNDTQISAWAISALASANKAGLRVNQDAFDGMKAWLDKVTEPEYGRVGYTSRGSGPARPREETNSFPADRSESLTAAGIWCRLLIGERAGKSGPITKGAELCEKSLPAWDAAGGTIDMEYWYWGTLAMYEMDRDRWTNWRDALLAAVVDHQRADGDEKGSWDPIGVWGRYGGRVYSTAILTATLLVADRYPRFADEGGSHEFFRRPTR